MATKEQNDFNNFIIDEYKNRKSILKQAEQRANHAATIIFLWGLVLGLFLGGFFSVLLLQLTK